MGLELLATLRAGNVVLVRLHCSQGWRCVQPAVRCGSVPTLRPDYYTPYRYRWNHPSVLVWGGLDSDMSEGSVDRSMPLDQGHLLRTPSNPDRTHSRVWCCLAASRWGEHNTSLAGGAQRTDALLRLRAASGTHTFHGKRTVVRGVSPGQPPIERPTASLAVHTIQSLAYRCLRSFDESSVRWQRVGV